MKTRRQTIQIMTTLAGLGLALALAVPALAAYIGPDRTVTEAYEYWR